MKLMQLCDAIQDLALEAPRVLGGRPLAGLDVGSLHYRAQTVSPGGLFVAVKGFAADGHDFIPQAVENGAAVVVSEQPVTARTMVLRVNDSRKALAQLAAEFYGHPSRHMTIVGITGTSGKTTVCYLIESMLKAAGHPAGVIGTVNYRYGGQVFDNPVTTPESLDLQRILSGMRAAGVTHAVMEISSHALDLSRVHACDVDVAVFTNLSQDHLDFHHDMERYWQSKRTLFTRYLPAGGGKTAIRAVINTDDPRGGELAGQLSMPHLTTSRSGAADIQAVSPQCSLEGLTATVLTAGGEIPVRSSLVGQHNLENILTAVGVARALALAPEAIQTGIETLDHVPGRLERVADPDDRRFVYVDYAHKPDALEKVLTALGDLTHGRIISVFGCGGDRDRSKRSIMGAIAARLSDLMVVTSDNPRTEPPEQIIAQIIQGVRQEGLQYYKPSDLPEGYGPKGYVIEADRRKAIALAIRAAGPGDTVLIAGKGHEPYQIIGKEKFPFDDRIEAAKALSMIKEQ